MEKSLQLKKDISFSLDVRIIPQNGLKLILEATPAECAYLARHYDLPAIHSFCVQMQITSLNEIIQVVGVLSASVCQNCVITLEEFDQLVQGDFKLLFSEDKRLVEAQENQVDFDPDEEPIELIQKGHIYFKELLAEQLGLYLDPFPRKVQESFSYYEEKAETVRENPFSVLKHLTKP